MNQPHIGPEPDELFTIQEAGAWASGHLGRQVTASNISYLVQYGKIERRDGLVSRNELAAYTRSSTGGARRIGRRNSARM